MARKAVAFLFLAAAACSAPGPTPPPVSETLRVALRDDPGTLDPLLANTTSGRTVSGQIFEPLVDLDPSLRPTPRLAAAWSREADGRAWRFKLRPGARWPDGSEVSPADVAATLRRALDPAVPSLDLKSLFAGAGAAEISGPHEVRIPFAGGAAPSLSTWQRLPILSDHDSGDSAALAARPRGSGAYRLLSWRKGEWILLERNPEWWGGVPPIPFVLFRIFPDALTASRALALGEVDIAPLRAADRARAARGDSPYRVVEYDPQIVCVVVWNLRVAGSPFTDVRVRRALTLAFDRQGFAERIRRGLARPAATLYTPVWRRGRPELRPLPYDPVEAARLLDEAGWRAEGTALRHRDGRPFSFSLLFAAEDELRRDVSLVLQSDLAKVGIEVRLERVDPVSLVRRLRGHDFVAAVHLWKLDPEPRAYDFLHSSQAESGLNYGGVTDAALDRLLEREASARDERERAEAGRAIEARLQQEAPLLFVCFPISLIGVDPRVEGFEVGPLGPLAGTPGAAGLRLRAP